MIKNIAPGHKFALQTGILLALFVVLIPVLFSAFEVKREQNFWILSGIVFMFASIAGVTAFNSFKPERIKPSVETIVETSLLAMLFSTLMTISASVIITTIFIVSTISYAIIKKRINNPHPLFYFAAAYYLFQLIGLSWSIDLHRGLKYIDKGFLFIAIPFAFSCYIITKARRNSLLKVFFRCVFVFVLCGLIGYVFQIHYIKLDILTGFGLQKGYLQSPLLEKADYEAIFIWWGYGHPTFLSFIFTLAFGIGVELYLAEPKSASRISVSELILYGFCSMALIIVLQSRLGMSLFPLGVLVAGIWAIRNNRKLLYTVIAISISALIIGGAYLYFSYSDYFFDSARSVMFDASMKYIKEHPWLGTGTGGMHKQIVLDLINPHNQYYGEILHLGIIGALVLWTLIGATIYYGVKNKNFLLLYFMLLLLMLMMTEMPFSIHKGIILFNLFVFLFIRPDWEYGNTSSNQQIQPVQ